MNPLHRRYCGSRYWARQTEERLLPWALDGVDLGARTVEIGPGYGANLRVLTRRTHVTAVELDARLAEDLQERYGDVATILTGDGTATGLPGGEFSAVVCFMMLHHVPTAAGQDALFAEAFRLLEPGGVFAGSDGEAGLVFRLVHLGDTYNPVPHETLRGRLQRAGFDDVTVARVPGQQRWVARKAT